MIAGSVSGVVGNVAFGANPADISTWYLGVAQGLIQQIMTGYAATRNASLTYLTRHAAMNRAAVDVVPGSLDVAALQARMQIVGPVGFKSAIAAGQSEADAVRHMATNMAGVADEAVRDGDRDVIVQTAMHGRGVVGWRRRLSGHACGFCAMLASRGSVYVTRDSAVPPSSHAYHPHCRCYAEPLYRHQQEPPEVRTLQRQWRDVTAGTSGKEAQRVWRQHWEQRATPQAQAAHGIQPRELQRAAGPDLTTLKAADSLRGGDVIYVGPNDGAWARNLAPGGYRVEGRLYRNMGGARKIEIDLKSVSTGRTTRAWIDLDERVTVTVPPKAAPVKAAAAPKPPTLAALKKTVTDAGITVPAGAPREVVENLVDALRRGVAPAQAREAAVREMLELRAMVGDKLAQVAAALENGASERAMAHYAKQLERLSSGEGGLGYPTRAVPELGKPLQPLIDALKAGDAAAASEALPKAVTGSKLKALGEPGRVVSRTSLGKDIEWVGAGRGDVVEVMRPGYTATVEGKTVTVTKPSVRTATPEQAQAFRVSQAVKKAPAKATAHKATTPAEFDARAEAAASGQSALAAPPIWASQRAMVLGGGEANLTVRGLDAFAARQRQQILDAIDAYRGLGYKGINRYLRTGQDVRGAKTAVAGIDRAMAQSKLAEDVVLWRGLPELPVSGADLAGMQFSDRAYVSTSSAKEVAARGGPVLMRILAPRGTGAIRLSDHEAEVLLDRDLTFRIVRDNGPQTYVDGFGRRHELAHVLDVEVVPKSAPARAVAPKATPAKAAAPRVPKAPEPAKMSLPALRTELDKVMERAGATVDLATVPKQALAEFVQRARTLPESELTAEVGRWRQVVIDRRRDVADLLAQADQLIDAGASAEVLGQRGAGIVRRWEQAAAGWPDLVEARKVVAAMQTGNPAKIRAAIKAAQKKLGLQQIGEDAGKVVRYDRATMSPISGAKIPPDAHVVVVRPGYRMPDGTVLAKPVVEEATGIEALPRLEKVARAEQEAKSLNPGFGTTREGPVYRQAPAISTSPRTGKVVSRRYTPDMGPLPSGAYEENCTNVVMAFEMRMRGYDIHAAPLHVLDSHGYAAGRTVDELDDLLKAAWRAPGGGPFPASRLTKAQAWRSFAEIDAEIARDWPEGGRGFMTVGKHVFNVIKRNGKAVYVEAQFDVSAGQIVTGAYKRKYKSSAAFGGTAEEAKVVRLDDLVPADGILETVQAAS